METAQSVDGGPVKQAVSVPAGSPIKTSFVSPGDTYPLVLSPTAPGVDLATWAAANRPFILDALAAHGALLFRGFEMKTPLDFEKVAGSICSDLFGEYGDLPHEDLTNKIYHSTPYPADKAILFHNESSHLPRWPVKQFFFCVQASTTGGETPLLDCREVYRVLDKELLAKFEEKGLMYVRNFCEDIDVPWHEFFKTKDKKEVERICKEGGMESEWVRGRTLRIKQRGRAVIKHPRTGEKVFFNQVQLHHPYCLDPATRKSLVALFKEEGLPRNVYYGDGSKIEDATMAELDRVFWKHCKAAPWQVGDLIMLDNMIISHARKPFTGSRKIVVAMGEMFNATDLPS